MVLLLLYRWHLRLTCAQPVLGFAHDALFNHRTAAPTHRKPVGSQKHAQKTCQQALEKSQVSASCRVSKPISTMSRLLASGVVVER